MLAADEILFEFPIRLKDWMASVPIGFPFHSHPAAMQLILTIPIAHNLSCEKLLRFA